MRKLIIHFKTWPFVMEKSIFVGFIIEALISITVLAAVIWSRVSGQFNISMFKFQIPIAFSSVVCSLLIMDVLHFALGKRDNKIFANIVIDRGTFFLKRYLLFALASFILSLCSTLLVTINDLNHVDWTYLLLVNCFFLFFPFAMLWIVFLVINEHIFKYPIITSMIKIYILLTFLLLPFMYYPYVLFKYEWVIRALGYLFPWASLMLVFYTSITNLELINFTPFIMHIVLSALYYVRYRNEITKWKLPKLEI